MLHVAIAAAAAAAMTPMVPVMPTAVAATAVVDKAAASAIADTGATMTAVATVTGDGLAVTAQQGDADNREENRDA